MTRALGFFAGLLLALFPAAAVWGLGFLGLVGSLRQSLLWKLPGARGIRMGRHLIALLLGATAFVLPLHVNGHERAASLTLQSIILILVYLGFSSWPAQRKESSLREVTNGLAFALVIFAAVSLFQVIADGNVRPAGWMVHPNIWAVSTLLPFGGVLLFSTRVPIQLLAACSVATTTILTGSRAAFLGFAFLMLGFAFLRIYQGRQPTAQRLLIAFSLVLLPVLAVLSLPGLGGPLGMQRSLVLFSSLSDHGAENRNLLEFSEDLSNTMWVPFGVSVTSVDDATMEESVFLLVKEGAGAFSRLQQRVTLQPEAAYTLSGEFKMLTSGARPGIAGWGETETGEGVGLSVSLADGEGGSTSGNVEIRHKTVSITDDGWTRLEVTMVNGWSSPLTVSIGPAPDLITRRFPAELLVRRLQFENGPAASEYSPTDAITYELALARKSANARADYFAIAWLGFTQSPWLGKGSSYEDFYSQSRPTAPDLPGHAHNLFLQTLFQGGMVGLAGLSVLFGVVTAAASRNRPAFLLLFLAVVVVNLADYTFWSAGVSYPYFAVAGLLTGSFTSR